MKHLVALLLLSFAAHAKDAVLIIDGRNNHDWKTTTESLAATLRATGRFKGVAVPGSGLALAPSLAGSVRVRGPAAGLGPVLINGLLGSIGGRDLSGWHDAARRRPRPRARRPPRGSHQLRPLRLGQRGRAQKQPIR